MVRTIKGSTAPQGVCWFKPRNKKPFKVVQIPRGSGGSNLAIPDFTKA